MSKQQPELSNETLLALWLEGRLSAAQLSEFESRCVRSREFAQKVEEANALLLMAEEYQPEQVPNWNRGATFEENTELKWWQWQGLSSLAFVTSCCAIVVVLTGLQVRIDEGALTIGFAAKQTSQDVENLVNERLQEFKQAQQVILHDYAQNMRQQQLDASTQLTQYLLSASRKERREDFAELIKHVNEQRGDDQLFYARQLNKLQHDIYAIPLQSGTGDMNE
ncbi:hypothetical protein [Paraglaciecola sp. 2405UD69-4]|uniref:hypothetical protein n=1 Tax=Paraglaciecola sp. 2405UD69-4 TaxID=3391836 RepID=UPI0039C981D7